MRRIQPKRPGPWTRPWFCPGQAEIDGGATPLQSADGAPSFRASQTPAEDTHPGRQTHGVLAVFGALMFSTPAYAQAVGAAAGGGLQDGIVQFLPIVLIMVAAYFLLLRPQQQRAKKHQELIKAVKRGDTVVLSSGVIGKVFRVEDTEVQVELAPNVVVKVVRAMISDVRVKGEPAPANDTKS